ncbi:dihydroneopterin aldolase [Tetzosporium hominis]|uniref:7,8-dihydroneopterin aldolase n=1 Tax=Tetzosporium hominis TaxID=2020506 RepID=A0A264W371_9BACL|nr:dihydroneopterin aldolase [Tetzosporium hominis]OZS78033.1 dihydroneopterin aldolase [Tetzosporium hominis]
MDKIYLNDMQFYGYHGVLPEETVLGQLFRITVEMAVDLKQAGETDALDATVNYAEVYELCKAIAEGEPYQLIESVAEKIADAILTNYSQQVKGCKVLVVKPTPPIRGHYHSVAVEITRGTL